MTLSLLLSLPINIFLIAWLFNSITFYFSLDKYELTLSKGVRLSIAFETEFNHLKNKTVALFGVRKPVDIELIIKENKLNALDSNLPYSGMDYKKDSYMIIDNKAIKGSVKYRGDHYYHWAFPDKSWRFKTSKKNIYQGIHKHNFITPKNEVMLYNHMSYQLAKRMGLLAPESALIELSINGVYSGPKLMVEQIDESFLRKNKRMPNDIYKGDNIGANKYTDIKTDLFDQASLWEKAATNNHYPENNLVPLSKLITDIASDDYSTIDIDAFASMAAYIDLTGSYHHDRIHNWYLLYDAYYERMYPIIWDTVGWLENTVHREHMNIATSKFLEYLYRNQTFQIQKIKSLKRFFAEPSRQFYRDLEMASNKSKSIIQSNGYSYNLGRKKFSENDALLAVDAFNQSLHSRIERVKEYFLGPAVLTDYGYDIINDSTLRIKVDGSKLINQLIFTTDQAITALTDANLSFQQSNNTHTKDLLPSSTITENQVVFDVELLANNQKAASYAGSKTINSPVTYDINLVGLNTRQINQLQFKFNNLTDQTLVVPKNNIPDVIEFNAHINNIFEDQIDATPLVLSGEIIVAESIQYDQKVTINPGTTFLIAPNASIKFTGQVTAIGSQDKPITFKPLSDKQPWNAVVVKDVKSNGSRFAYCDFIGGSGEKGDMYEYTAMLSIHNVKDIVFDHCGFYDSKLTDDMIHVIYSEAQFINSQFVRSLSDALDADISKIVIANSEFIDSGNDSIDLMTAQAVVYNTRFIQSADKGISIGEGSELLAFNNHIENSEIGMQSKDTSVAFVYDTTFINNNKAIDAYHKNWRYSEGGKINLHQCVLTGNQENATVGKKSTLVLNRCAIDDINHINRQDLEKQKIRMTDDKLMPNTLSDEFFAPYQLMVPAQVDHGSH